MMSLLAAGLSHREIPPRSPLRATQRTYIKNTYGKLQARNRVEALSQARAYGLI